MKQIVILLILAFSTFSGLAQECFNIRTLTSLPMSEPNGYWGSLSKKVPGGTTLEKADSCLAWILNEFETELQGVELSTGSLTSNSLFESVRYKRLIDGILVQEHGISFDFDHHGVLISISSNILVDSTTQVELESLAANGFPAKHEIVYGLNGYSLRLKGAAEQVASPAPSVIGKSADIDPLIPLQTDPLVSAVY